MRHVNLANPEFVYDSADPDGFRSGMFRFGPLVGAKQMGATVYELPAGQALCPYHYEYGEEEWLLVLDGRPTVRHAGGSERLDQWDVVCFEPGPTGAHQIRNDGDQVARVLMWSTIVYPTGTAYPDSGKVALWTGDQAEDIVVKRSSGVGYWEGEG